MSIILFQTFDWLVKLHDGDYSCDPLGKLKKGKKMMGSSSAPPLSSKITLSLVHPHDTHYRATQHILNFPIFLQNIQKERNGSS